jgi:transcriptional regulator with GAF, ATPase, and Fis domain
VRRAAASDATVLVLGENGTGKEVVARAVHQAGARREKPFVAVSCSALPDTLLESELFGYEKGAFTGAWRSKPGRFELAEGGTLFLDEIGDLDPGLQVKLLRVIQDRSFERLGGTRTLKADVRLIAATNRDLRRKVAEGGFREDLFYRLYVVPIILPPLRQRREDIPELARFFLNRFTARTGKRFRDLHPQALEAMMAYAWPGNVRELENVIERGVALYDDTLLLPEYLDLGAATSAPASTAEVEPAPTMPGAGPWDRVEQAERSLILEELGKTHYKVARAAAKLGISRATLYRKMEHYHISARNESKNNQ